VNVVGDNNLESDETFSVSLANPVGAVLESGASSAAAQVRNDDVASPPSYSFSASAATVQEGGALAIGIASANVAPGSQLFWVFSGDGITSSDLGGSPLAGKTQIGIDGRASFSVAIAADGIIDPNEILELRFFKDAALTQQVGDTLATTIKEPTVGIITESSDVLTGTSASEILAGIPTGSTLRGRGSLDQLTGGGGNDLFLLGDAQGHFYDDGLPGNGTTDMAILTDFNAGDRIQLHGNASDYTLVSGRHNRIAGVRIDAIASGSPECIGFVQGAKLATLNLADSTQFIFV
jgi:hypothetical protein